MPSERTIILASASPRRQELLSRTGLKFKTDPSEIHEDLTLRCRPEELVLRIAEGKARSVASRYPNALIIAADTIGVVRGRVIGKPHNAEDAVQMLRQLSGRSHRVISGLTLMDSADSRILSAVVETRVYFKKLSDEEIKAYVRTGEPLDKVGAYAIQGLGGLLVEKIHGDYYNVIGLPLNTLYNMLTEFGINIIKAV